MAGVEIPPGSQLASALTELVQSKVAEIGWSSGAEDDSALAQYIVLMLGNDKSKDNISTELANDLLGSEATKATASQFVDWLFETVENLKAQQQQHQQPASVAVAPSGQADDQPQDMAMDETTDDSPASQIPTGPKSMRGQGHQRGRDKRMLGQMRNAMDRSQDQSLHRIRGAAGTGRVARPNAEPPKGPKAMTRPSHGQNRFGPGNSMMNGNGVGQVTPNQQMQLMQMLEEQSKMMAQMLAQGGAGVPAINPRFFGNKPRSEKSLQERLSQPLGSKGEHSRSGSHNKGNSDAQMLEAGLDSVAADSDTASETKCKFQLRCTSATCPYAHQSPAAPANADFDVNDRCNFGVACTNWKCHGRHPSPAQKIQHAATVDCKFYPNCTNTACPFRHPETPPCKNGADCPERENGCEFSHSTIECRFRPCMNKQCKFKHAEGQKGGNVWTANGTHTSERKLVSDDGMQEELILPGQNGGGGGDNVEMAVETQDAQFASAAGAAAPEAALQQDVVT